MTKPILKIYDFFRESPFSAWGLFLAVTIGLIASILTLAYKEDISDFLPLDEDNHTALTVYQDISGANKIYAIISLTDSTFINPDSLVSGVDSFVEEIESIDSLNYLLGITKTIDIENMSMVMDEVYKNIPYFLTDEDYARIDSILSIKGYVDTQLVEDKQLLMLPSSGMVGLNISRDPLNLFTPVLGRLQEGDMPVQFETYDGYILSPDGQKAIVILESSFGAHESENNAKLLKLLDSAVTSTELCNPGIDIHIIGGPVIAVSNANQIKKDSIMAISVAGILILLLLLYVFRNLWNILLIIVSVGWGWLFAMGGIALYYDSVSIIVIGIASVILGIAVNYPLHLIEHLKDSSHPRVALKEVISPLIVGNVTTVGAFLCLVPLNAPALHDLGLFSSLLLVGTIFFVLIFLPHIIKTKSSNSNQPNPYFISKLAGISLDSNKYAIGVIILLTFIFGYFSLNTEFDSDMRNINFMTKEQKTDVDYFQSLFSTEKDTKSIFIVSNGNSWNDALSQNELIDRTIDSLSGQGLVKRHNAVSSFLLSKETQKKKLDKWNTILNEHYALLRDTLQKAAITNGFNPEAFAQFDQIISGNYQPKEFDDFEPLVSTVFIGNISQDKESGRHSLVQTIEVPNEKVEDVKNILAENKEFGGQFFDVRSMNGSIANTLSNDFNYIGIACGCIVFLFLWLSFGSVELAIVSFIPMAVSWIWILGIMGILGIKFNIVNVILATFIFGQGDDYTIFMTEGMTYEFAYRKTLLNSYKSSIIVSAIIMFIGIGTLIFAKHPALKSLGEVTVVGMLSVVLMAYLFPPLIFNWLVKRNDKVRYRPITLKKILYSGFCAATFFVQLITAYVWGFFLFVISKPSPRKRLWFHKYNCSIFRFDIKRMPGINLIYENDSCEKFEKPAVIICNHQSLLDSFCMMFLSPKIILLANEHIRVNPIIRIIFKWSNFISVSEGAPNIVDNLKSLVSEGYSIAIFPEGARPENGFGEVMRFHKGAFHIAEKLNLDIIPVYLYGLNQIMPKGAALSNGGTMYIGIGKRIPIEKLKGIGDLAYQARTMRNHYKEHLAKIHKQIMTVQEVSPIVFDKYLYKGRDIELSSSKIIKKIQKYSESLSSINSSVPIFVIDEIGNGEICLVLTLMYPHTEIFCSLISAEAKSVLTGCIQNFTTHIHILEEGETIGNIDATNIIVCAESHNYAEMLLAGTILINV